MALPELLRQSGKLPPGRYVIAVGLTDNAEQKELNHQFRGLNQPTNVLSFPQFTPRELAHLQPMADPVTLGDISLAYQYIVDESHHDNKTPINHMIHLVIHGILHILGYDHQTARHATMMENLERRVLATLHIPDPYAPAPDSRARRLRP